ncbi:hypothetical protein ACJX0J_041889, partial [Zea mays]
HDVETYLAMFDKHLLSVSKFDIVLRSGHGVMFWHGTKFYYPDVFMMDAHVFRLERANEEYYSMLRSLAFNDTGIAFGIGFGANPAWGLDHGDKLLFFLHGIVYMAHEEVA